MMIRPCLIAPVLMLLCTLAFAGCQSTAEKSSSTPHANHGAATASAQKAKSSPEQDAASVSGKPSPEAAVKSTEHSSTWPAAKLTQAHAHYAAGIIHEMNDETEQALQDYFQAAMNDPENEGLVLEISRKFLQNKQAEKAQEILQLAASRPKASGAIFARLGLIYSQLGKNDQAAIANRAAIKRSPELLAGYQNLFLSLLQTKQQAEALKVLDEAARVPKADAEFLLTLAELYSSYILQAPTQRERVQPKGLAVLNRAAALKPANPSSRLRLADDYRTLGDTKKAAECYSELLRILPDLPILRERVHANLAEIYLHDSDPKKAAEHLRELIKDDPTNPQAYFFLGTVAFENKDAAEAADCFSKTILLKPDYEAAYYELARAQISLNKASDALETLDKARKRFAPNFIQEFWSGLARSRQKDFKEALQHYNAAEVIAKATNTNLLDQLFYFQVGAAHERTGDFVRAEESFQKCLAVNPNFAEALNYLGYMWAEHGTNLTKARELIEKALRLEPKNAAYLDSMGWLLFKSNQPKEALEYVLKAVELIEEPDPTLYDHLGDIYASLQQPEKAREAWTKSLSLEPSDEVKKKLGADSSSAQQKTPGANGEKGQ